MAIDWACGAIDVDTADDVRALGIGFLTYSLLGRGFLTGKIKRFEDLVPDDYRRIAPRFQGENFQRNRDLVAKVEDIAREKGGVAAHARVGARAGGFHRPVSRHEAPQLPRGERRRGGDRAHRGRAAAPRRGGAEGRGRRPSLPGDQHEAREPVSAAAGRPRRAAPRRATARPARSRLGDRVAFVSIQTELVVHAVARA
ncbi:aldo/keto reductase [Sorangium sp. So ce260]